MTVIEIPYEELPPETLEAVIEEFVSRQGTDYGFHEVSLQRKVEQVKRELGAGTVAIVYDWASRACHIVPRQDLDR